MRNLMILTTAAFLAAFTLFGTDVRANEKSEYVFRITITRAGGDQEVIYTDFYVLSGTSTASSIVVGHSTAIGSGTEFCDSHTNIAVAGGPGLHVKNGKEESLDGVHTSWDIAWNDVLTIVGQKWNRQTTPKMQKCPFPLIRMVPDEKE